MAAVPAVVLRGVLLHRPHFMWNPLSIVRSPCRFSSPSKVSGFSPLVCSVFAETAPAKTAALYASAGGGGGELDDSGEVYEGRNKGGKKENGILMSQKITLAYAFLLGIGGIMGYIKRGSQKSLAAGGSSALILIFFVYKILPTKPILGSVVGLALSGTILGVMWHRFMISGHFFPAGGVAAVSLVMSIGYLHGMVKTLIKSNEA